MNLEKKTLDFLCSYPNVIFWSIYMLVVYLYTRYLQRREKNRREKTWFIYRWPDK